MGRLRRTERRVAAAQRGGKRLPVKVFEKLVLAASAAFIVRALNVACRCGEPLRSVEPSSDLPDLSIVVPARNEERQIERCVRSLLDQRYARMEVIVVDDRSTDATRAIVEGIAASESCLRIVHGSEMPRGWVGKPWALEQGARAARGAWLLFTDADTIHEPLAAASAIQYARERGLDVLSLLTTQDFESVAERIVLPTILWLIGFAVGSIDAINDPKRLDAAIFNGQFLLFSRTAYEALGGHAAVAGCIAEDYAFAVLVKRDGRFRGALVDANDLVHTRMYRSLREIWYGFTKNLFVAARERPLAALAGTLGLLALAPLPEILCAAALRRRRFASAAAMAGAIAATAAAAEFGMRRSRFPRYSGVFFPIGVVVTMAIFANSAIAYATGCVSWRGRTYGAVAPQDAPG